MEQLRESWGFISEFWPLLLKGAGNTVQLTLISALLMVVIAFVAGFGRISPWRPVRAVTTIYIEFFRGTSLLVQLFWFFYALPQLGIRLTPWAVAILVLALCLGAYAAEVVRACIVAVPKTQIEAAVALNMTSAQRMRIVILPQAVRAMLPPFGNLLIEMVKATSLVSLIAIHDLMFQARIATIRTYKTIEIFTMVLIMYFIISQVLSYGVKQLERRYGRGIVQGPRI